MYFNVADISSEEHKREVKLREVTGAFKKVPTKCKSVKGFGVFHRKKIRI